MPVKVYLLSWQTIEIFYLDEARWMKKRERELLIKLGINKVDIFYIYLYSEQQLKYFCKKLIRK